MCSPDAAPQQHADAEDRGALLDNESGIKSYYGPKYKLECKKNGIRHRNKTVPGTIKIHKYPTTLKTDTAQLVEYAWREGKDRIIETFLSWSSLRENSWTLRNRYQRSKYI